jgi:gluconokinase
MHLYSIKRRIPWTTLFLLCVLAFLRLCVNSAVSHLKQQLDTSEISRKDAKTQRLQSCNDVTLVIHKMATAKQTVILGIDVGTSGVRSALFDETGVELPGASAQKSRNLSTQAGFAELDAETAFQLVVQTIDELLTNPRVDNTEIELISLSCFWHSLLAVTPEGRPLTPIFTWADTRQDKAVDELRMRFDEREVHSRTGCRFHPSYWPAKLCWLREEFSGFQEKSLWLGFGEYLGLRLCGQTGVSVSMASATGLLNQRSCDWDKDLLQELQVSRDKLPEVLSTNQTLGPVNEPFATRWPQLRNARIYPAIGDGAANNIGSGCHSLNRAALMVGTSGALRILYQGEPPTELPPALWCYRADRRRVVIGGALSDGGGLYRWLTDCLGVNDNTAPLQQTLAQMKADAHGLTILPFWSGERSTGWNAKARGAILGLSMETKATDIIRAAMESVAYRFALILTDLETIAPGPSLFASGNALRNSPLWIQIIADVLNRPVAMNGISEASTRGAALLALEAAGKIQNLEEFSIPVDKVFEPDAERHALYLAGLARQQEHYDLLINPRGQGMQTGANTNE